jgi:predicted amidohydrolase
MRIALCQLQPMAGDVAANTEIHLRMMQKAAEHGADVAAFPELSMTGYEPAHARRLAFSTDDLRIEPLRAFAAAARLQALVGAPLRASDKPRIGAAWLARCGTMRWLAKQWLHEDELPFFEAQPPGPPVVDVEAGGVMRIGIAICYELSRPEHAASAFADGAAGYLATVAKTARGVGAAHARLAQVARERRSPAWMVNCVGPCDGVVAAGSSAAWSPDGRLLASLPPDEAAILLVDARSWTACAVPA